MAMAMNPEIDPDQHHRGGGRQILSAGDYLVEALLARTASSDVCQKAITAMGWEEVIVDESPRKAASTLLRFVARIPPGKRMLIDDSAALRWTYVRRLSLDPYSDLRLELLPFKLITGETSEVRFLSRLGQRDTRGEALARDVVEKMLKTMGFAVLKLAALKQNMRLPTRPGAGMSLWISVLRWDGPKSVITIQDPFYFEDLAPIASHALASPSGEASRETAEG